MAVRIPERRIASLAKLIGLSASDRQKLEDALKKAEPVLDRMRLAAWVAAESGLPEEDVNEFLRVLIELVLLRTRKFEGSLEEYAAAVTKAANETENESISLGGAAKAEFEEFLTRVFALDSMFVGAKGVNVLLEHQRRYCDARVLSDLRPIFGQDPSETPTATVLVHTLKLVYHEGRPSHETKEFFLALDSDDIRELKQALERAIVKETPLAEMSTKSGVPCLKWEA